MKLRKKIISVLSAVACAVSFCTGAAAITVDDISGEADSQKILYGDVNGDGLVNVRDASRLVKYLLDWDNYPLTEYNKECANCSYDEWVTSADLYKLKEYLIGNIPYSALGPQEGDHVSTITPDPIKEPLIAEAKYEELYLSSDKHTVYPGERVTLELYLECDDNLESADFIVDWSKYNRDLRNLRCRGIEVMDETNTQVSFDDYSAHFLVFNPLGSPVPDGVIARMGFEIPYDAQYGEYFVDFSEVKTFAIYDGADISATLRTEEARIRVEQIFTTPAITTTTKTTTTTVTTAATTSKSTTATSKSTTSKKTTAVTKITTVQTTTATKNEIPGDANGDGETNVADIVEMQKYLFKFKIITKEVFIKLDLYKDGKFNVFDLIILKRKIINSAQ